MADRRNRCIDLILRLLLISLPNRFCPRSWSEVRVADQTGFHAFSMGEHYNIPGLQRVHQIPALAGLCAEVKNCASRYCGNAPRSAPCRDGGQ